MLRTNTSSRTGDDPGSSLRSQLTPVAWGDGAQAEGVNVTACLADIEALIQTMWGPKIRFDLCASADLPVLTCDRANLQAAIMNLLLNARDAMPDGGAVSVVATAVHDGYGAIELRVADNGLGMNEDTVRRAADPFFTTKSTGLGGLGLPMVKRFVQETGGRLHIESEPGVGTSVTLLLPLST